jgi:threonine dehydratase
LNTVIYPRATTEFIYRYNSPDIAHVYISFKLSTANRQAEVAEVLSTLENRGMKGFDIIDDEMAKSHARYMIGGAKTVENERIFRFGSPLRYVIHNNNLIKW